LADQLGYPAAVHLGFEKVRLRRGGVLVGHDEISVVFNELVAIPVDHCEPPAALTRCRMRVW
jgi:hypothetical protein